MKSMSESYKAAGVDITAGYRAVELMKQHIARTITAGAASDIGGFGGLFELDITGMERPVLVSGTDGVGTKLKLAFIMDKHDTIGIDCVAMCVNDIICCGAKPLFFLDYIACGKNVPERIAEIVKGVAEGCVQSGAALIGGETAEMPGFYGIDEYDLAGFSVGVVDKKKVFDNSSVKEGDVIIGLPSSGVHSNGFSLVRKIFDIENRDIKQPVAELGGLSLGEALLTPTKIYVKPVLALLDKDVVHLPVHACRLVLQVVRALVHDVLVVRALDKELRDVRNVLGKLREVNLELVQVREDFCLRQLVETGNKDFPAA